MIFQLLAQEAAYKGSRLIVGVDTI